MDCPVAAEITCENTRSSKHQYFRDTNETPKIRVIVREESFINQIRGISA